ncbi:hypothetical protein CL617_05310 [archaeon]|nr:hypothetical protein [archaeon]|tara:strand:+ start:2532 stop:3038 length:507 start_codon:yes stop_codon:yes gene_type:complete
MDIFAHGFWSYAIFHRRSYALKAVLAGILPDIVSFGPHFLLSIFAGTFTRGKPGIETISDSTFMLYNFTHSFIIFIFVALLIFIITKKVYLWLLAWPLHTFVDIFTHSTDFFPTPFLFPLSSYKFDGHAWGNKYFMIANYSVLIIVYLLIFYYSRKRKIGTKKHSKNN